MTHVICEQDGPVLRLVLDRLDKKNALTDAMYGELAGCLNKASADPDVRVVIVTGAGDVFTAGNDIADFAAAASGEMDFAMRNVHAFLGALTRFPKPVVAAVPGLAVGIGTTMLLHCDYVLLAESARLSVPFVNLGIVPEAASSVLLQARVGYARAFAMFALGEMVDAASALAWGLANKVVHDGQLADEAMKVAQALAGRSASSLLATKRLMRDEAVIATAIEAETASFRACLQSPEAKAAFKAFAERKKV